MKNFKLAHLFISIFFLFLIFMQNSYAESININTTGDSSLNFPTIFPTSPTTHFDKVNDTIGSPNDDTNLISSDGAGGTVYDLFNKGSSGLSNKHIDNITLIVRGRDMACFNNRGLNECVTSAAASTPWNGFISNGTSTVDGGTSTSTSWTTVTTTWVTSPFTGWIWTLAEVENLKIGGTGTVYTCTDPCGQGYDEITQLYLQVNYSNPVTVLNVTLITPLNNTAQTSPVTFSYLPRIDGGSYKNCSLFTNYTGTWVYTNSNATSISDGAPNTITHTFATSKNNTIWNVYCYNATGTTSNSSSTNFTLNITVDTSPPTYSKNQTNTTGAGSIALFQLEADDDTALNPNGKYIFSTNNTGTWLNASWVSFTATPQNMTNTTILNTTIGTKVAWCFYFNDSAGNWNGTSCSSPFILTTTDITSPTYSKNSTNTTVAGQVSLFQLEWNDSYALQTNGQWIFSINSSGVWRNYSAITQLVPESWNNKAYYSATTGSSNPSSATYTEMFDSQYNSTNVSDNNRLLETVTDNTAGSISYKFYKYTFDLTGFNINNITSITYCFEGYWSVTGDAGDANLTYWNVTSSSWIEDQAIDPITESTKCKSFTSRFNDLIDSSNMFTFVVRFYAEKYTENTQTNLYTDFVNLTVYTNQTNFTATPQNASFARKLNSTVGTVVAWCYYATDNVGNWNGTSCSNPFSFKTTGTYYQNISQSLSITSSAPTKSSFLRRLVAYFTIYQPASRKSSIFKSLFQSINISSIITRIVFRLRSITSSFIINQSVSRILSSIRKVTFSFSINTVSSRILSSIRSIASSFIVNNTALKLGTIFKSISQSLSLNTISSRLLTGLRQASNYFTINTASTRLSSFLRTLSQSLGITNIVSRISTLLRPITQSFTINSISSSLSSFYKSITGYFTINTVSTRILSSIRSISNNLAISSTITRTLSSIRSITSSFIVTATSSRIRSVIKSISQTISLNTIYTRILGISQVSISQLISISSSINRTISSVRLTADSFMLANTTSRIRLIFSTLSQSLSLSTISSRVLSSIRSLTGYLTVNTTSYRIVSLIKNITNPFVISSAINRNILSLRSISGYFIFNSIATNLQSYIKSIFQTISLISYSGTIQGAYKRYVQLLLTISDSSNRIITIARAITQSLNINSAFNRILSLIRTILESIGINHRITPSVACSVLKIESSCAAYSCYWCSGLCQSSTCPTPTPPSGGGGGGGGWIGPTKNVTNITREEIAFDIGVNVENEQVVPGDKVYATVSMLKYAGPKTVTDVNLTYWIENSRGEIIGMKESVVGVEVLRRDIYFLTVPMKSELGKYKFRTIVQYDSSTATASATFDVVANLPEFPILVGNIAIPNIFVNSSFDVNLELKNKINERIQANITLLFSNTFDPVIIIKNVTFEPLTAYNLSFRSTAHESGNFTVFIKIDHEGKKMIRDFDIVIYPAKEFYIYYLLLIMAIALIIIFTYYYKFRHKKHEKLVFVYKKEDS